MTAHLLGDRGALWHVMVQRQHGQDAAYANLQEVRKQGTTSLPAALEYSVVSATALLRLAATVEGSGMGRVSVVKPRALREALKVEWR